MPMKEVDSAELKKTQAENVELKQKLTEVEKTLTEVEKASMRSKLWFVVKNTTDAKVRFFTRCRLWNGKLTEWKEHELDKDEPMKICSESGCVSVLVKYDPESTRNPRHQRAVLRVRGEPRHSRHRFKV